ncbi:unnamed protein product [Peronospora belbahrii]|uniref:PHD-type domain-containing protein n=1 Tax=Peronospora belbahrii TaxID=622444 RepID=A0ABN8D6H2_9STRA|nr:unnamed protein product [Peronospora belbahrii]
MLSVGQDVEVVAALMRPKTVKTAAGSGGLWIGRCFEGFRVHLAPPVRKSMTSTDQERPASSPCPSSSSSSNSSNINDSSSNYSGSTSDGDEDFPVNNGSNGGDKGDDQKDKKEDEEDGHSSDASCISDNSTVESEEEEDDDGDEDDDMLLDTDNEKDRAYHDYIDPADDDDSEESDESSDLKNSYPRLSPAPVDALINRRQQEAHKELQLTDKLKQKVIADARQRHQERQEAPRSKKKRQTLYSKRRNFKSDVVSKKSADFERRCTTGSTGVVMALQEQEGDEWVVDCSCGLMKKNYDDGTFMIQCDSCSHWVHAKCADKQPEAVVREKFLCFRCSWMFDCVCSVRRRPNHDDGQRMVECESCKTWQHTICVRIPMTEEPADDYRCPRCVRRGRRRKSALKGTRNRKRQRKQSHAKLSLHRDKSMNASHVDAMGVRSLARTVDVLATSHRSHRSRRVDRNRLSKVETIATVDPSPPPIPAVSPPSTPPPPSSPPPPSAEQSDAHSGSTKRSDRSRRRNKRTSATEKERLSGSSTLSHRKCGRLLGSSSSGKKTRSESSVMEDYASPTATVTPSPRGKGLMLQGYSSAATRTGASSLPSVDVRPPLPLTPPSAGASSGNKHSHKSHGRKRNVTSARDRLAKKLKIRKPLLR